MKLWKKKIYQNKLLFYALFSIYLSCFAFEWVGVK